MFCIETEDLCHSFSKKETVLRHINLRVPQCSVYGFLGSNGAGKTTTLKLLLGLLKKQQGAVRIFGKDFENNRIDCLKKIGSLIETPSLYGHLTAFENLLLLQKIYKCPVSRISRVLELTGLSDTKNKKTRHFSLGMKQRLAIAIALLQNPLLLILDEPTNGLDPNGMIEIRELLQKLNKEEGTSIIISSHLLSEIEKLVTHVGIINEGSLVFEGTLNELVSKQQASSFISLRTDDHHSAVRVIQQNNYTILSADSANLTIPVMPDAELAALNRQLVAAGIGVFELTTVKNNLETIFMDLITKK